MFPKSLSEQKEERTASPRQGEYALSSISPFGCAVPFFCGAV